MAATTPDKKNLLADIDVEGLIKKSLKETAGVWEDLKQSPKTPTIVSAVNESYVAEPKAYNQVSEFVSQKTKESHVALYQSHIDTLNRVSAELDTASRGEADSKHSVFRNLKIDETRNLNSVWLHELYFANCFDPHSEVYMDSMSYLRLERDFGTFEDWQKDFMACAMACGQGWAVCGYNTFLKRYVNTIVNCDSVDVMLGLHPLIVVDMHEHSYFKDYRTDKKSFLIAMMREFNWNVVEERFKKAEGINQVLK